MSTSPPGNCQRCSASLPDTTLMSGWCAGVSGICSLSAGPDSTPLSVPSPALDVPRLAPPGNDGEAQPGRRPECRAQGQAAVVRDQLALLIAVAPRTAASIRRAADSGASCSQTLTTVQPAAIN